MQRLIFARLFERLPNITIVAHQQVSLARVLAGEELPEPFLNRVVPAILEQTPDVKAEGALIDQFLVLNGQLRRRNAEQIAALRADGVI